MRVGGLADRLVGLQRRPQGAADRAERAGKKRRGSTIVKQSPKPGTVRAPGSAVNVKLG